MRTNAYSAAVSTAKTLNRRSPGQRFLTAALAAMLCLGLLSTSGCGWRLQGSYRLPPELFTIYLQSFDRYSELTRIVRERMRLQSVTVIGQPAADIPTLNIKEDRLFRRTLTLFENGQTAEYELNYTVTLELQRPDNEPYEFELTARRDYQDNPDEALAKTREVELLLKEMREEIADRIIRELARTDTVVASTTP